MIEGKPFSSKFDLKLLGMKKLIQFLGVSILVVSLLNSCESTPDQKTIDSASKVEKTEVLAENKTEVKMEVEGMVCAMGCAKFIEDKVAGLNGVVKSHVNFEEGTALFEFDKTALSSEEIEKFINEIHDGQYKAKIATSEATIDQEESLEKKETISSVSERINISIPGLFSYLIKMIR